MQNIIMADKPSGGLAGAWGSFYVERVTAGQNSVATMLDAVNYITGLRTNTSGTVVFIRRVQNESPGFVDTEFGGAYWGNGRGSGAGMRYKNGQWSSGVGTNASYFAVVQSGAVYDVVCVVQNMGKTDL